MPEEATNTDPPPRRIVLVSYWYPPAVGAAAERIHSFARYLPQNGWQAHVLTAKPGAAAEPSQPVSSDGSTLCLVPDPLAAEATPFADYDPRRQDPTWKTWAREIVFPDRFARWQRAALKAGGDLVRRVRPHLILASFPPASTVLLGLRLSQEAGLPLVLDFRDRWLGPGGYEPRLDRTCRKHAELEREAIHRAVGIITVSDTMADALAKEQQYDRGRICVVPNGYEPIEPGLVLPTRAETQTAIQNPESPLAFTLTHVGTVIARNRPDLFLSVLKQMRRQKALDGMVFRFVGNLSASFVADLGLSSLVATTGLLPRDRAREEMQRADALLLLTGDYVGRWGYNAKLFEYVQTGRPVLCLEETPGSNDRKLLERFARDRSFFASLTAPASITEQLDKLRLYVADHPSPAIDLDDAFRDYSRPNLAGRLAEYLNIIVAADSGRHRPCATAL